MYKYFAKNIFFKVKKLKQGPCGTFNVFEFISYSSIPQKILASKEK